MERLCTGPRKDAGTKPFVESPPWPLSKQVRAASWGKRWQASWVDLPDSDTGGMINGSDITGVPLPLCWLFPPEYGSCGACNEEAD